MPKFAAGAVRFQQEIFPSHQALFEQLADGQSPEALFISCSDSRVEPSMITQSGPGELFVVRNAGNIVPPHMAQAGGVTASIEFAVAALKVKHIVVCGHTRCGAMNGAMNPELLERLPHVRDWLAHTRAAVEIVNHLGPGLGAEERMQMLIEQNVVLQMTHLRTHPSVAARLATGDLELHGWVYRIRSGEVRAYDQASNRFMAVKDRYVDALPILDCDHD